MRPVIMRLATKIALESKTYMGITVNDAEYRMLDVPPVTDEMAEIALCLKVRKNMTTEEVAAKAKKPVEYVREQLEKLADVGVVRVNTENGRDVWLLPVFVPGIGEMMVANKAQVEKYPVIAEAFEQYTRERTQPLAPNIPIGRGLMRVIPIKSAIENDAHAGTYEEASYYVEKYDDISVAACSCRRTRRLMGEGCGHLEEDMCMQFGKGAEYYIRTGKGRRVTKAEAYDILQRAEENGLVHEIQNLEGEGETVAICNCCGCSCFGLRVSEYYQNSDFSRSNYVSQVDQEKCVACGQCVENCPMGALQLGRKLCAAEPLPEKPETVTPHDHVWMLDKNRWNPGFRVNRVLVDEATGTAPCKTACPAHLPIQGYVKLAAQGKYGEALELIKKNNPFPAICGRVCNRRCEDACSRGCLDDPIAIDDIKKFIAEQDMKAEHRYVPHFVNQLMRPFPEKIAVIGSGPAGLSCAYYLAAQGYTPTVFEKEQKVGGMMMLGIPSFRLEKDVVQSEIDVLKEMGVQFRTGVEVGRDVTIPQLRDEGYKAFYIAIGLQGTRLPGVPGEDAEGVVSGLDFMKRVNSGEDVKLKGRVVVIGGGNIASDIARTAVRCGAKSVELYCLESEKEMPMGPEDQDLCRSDGIAIHAGWGPKEFKTDSGKVKGVEFKRCFAVLDGNRRFNPAYDETDTVTAKADTVLLCIGQKTQWGDLLKGTRCTLGRGNSLVADGFTWQTNEPDIFAGGDAVTGQKFCIDAIAEGKAAATSLHRYVHEGQDLRIGRRLENYKELDKDNVDWDSFDRMPRQRPADLPGDSTGTMRDLRGVFTEEQLKKETDRCLKCGATQVDQFKCVGCGVCTTKCKFDAITLVRKYEGKQEKFETLMTRGVAPMVVKRVGRIAARTAETAAQKIKSAVTKAD